MLVLAVLSWLLLLLMLMLMLLLLLLMSMLLLMMILATSWKARRAKTSRAGLAARGGGRDAAHHAMPVLATILEAIVDF